MSQRLKLSREVREELNKCSKADQLRILKGLNRKSESENEEPSRIFRYSLGLVASYLREGIRLERAIKLSIDKTRRGMKEKGVDENTFDERKFQEMVLDLINEMELSNAESRNENGIKQNIKEVRPQNTDHNESKNSKKMINVMNLIGYIRSKPYLYLIIGCILLLMITNPTPDNFKNYLPIEEDFSFSRNYKYARQYNFILFSIYYAEFEYPDEYDYPEYVHQNTYLGVMKNFAVLDERKAKKYLGK